MLNPITNAQKAKGFTSFGATAKALLKKFPDQNWGLQPRSLETQIGKLDRGEAVWWINHPDIAQALADLLEISKEDLGLHAGAGTEDIFKFSAFPGLKPLDLKREAPWEIGQEKSCAVKSESDSFEKTLEEWLNPAPNAWRPPYGRHWLCVPDLLERQLLTRHLKATSHVRVVVTHTLLDGSAALQDAKPLILVVEGVVSEQDLNALGLRPRDAGLLVIAPNAIPIRQEGNSRAYESWERFNLTTEVDKRLFDLVSDTLFDSMTHWTWKLHSNWRSRLIQWVEKRLNRTEVDTLFDGQSIGNWLEEFDPLGYWFQTTSDLLHLCEVAHGNPVRKLPKSHNLDAGSRLAQLLFGDKSSQRSGEIKRLAEARWNQLELPWQGDLPLSDWMALLPAGHLPPSAEEVLAIASGKTAAERKKAATRIVSQLNEGNPAALRASGLLRENQIGQFDFVHQTLVRLLVRDKLMQQIANEPTVSWALACFDPERRRLVDAALNASALVALIRATKELILEAADTTNSAANLGASEALFVAIGRRIANREVIPKDDLPVVLQWRERVISKLDLTAVKYALPAPWSRPTQQPEQILEWLATCWAWSLLQGVEPNKQFESWLFPSTSESLPEPPCWLTDLWPTKGTKQPSISWQYLFTVAEELMKNWNQPPSNAPRILKIALLNRAAHGQWAAEPDWWAILNGHEAKWAEEILLERLPTAGHSAAIKLWPSYLKYEMGFGGKISYYAQLTSVRRWLLKQLSPESVLTNLTPEELIHLSSCPWTLPPAYRAPLLLARCQHISFESIADTTPFIARFGPSALPALPKLLTHHWLGSAAAEWLWAWDAAEAECILRNDDGKDIVHHHLTYACPINKTATVATLMLERPDCFGAVHRSSWARARLPTAGKDAETLVKIIQQYSSEKADSED